MSASNWGVCPKCQATAEAIQESRRKKAEKAYGKVTADEYAQLVADANHKIDTASSLREDYQIGITDDGEFFVIYRGDCQRCDFHHEFKHEKKLSIKASHEEEP